VQRSAADSILRDLQNNPDMWLQVMHILQNTQNLNTKFFALQVRLLFTEQLLDFWI
jgi:exportin-1